MHGHVARYDTTGMDDDDDDVMPIRTLQCVCFRLDVWDLNATNCVLGWEGTNNNERIAVAIDARPLCQCANVIAHSHSPH